MLAITTDIAGPWAVSSFWSLFSILYLFVCAGIIWKAGGGKGGLTLFVMALLGAALVASAGPPGIHNATDSRVGDENSMFSYRVICKADDGSHYWGDWIRTAAADEEWRFKNKYNDFDAHDRYHIDPPIKIYSMHDPSFDPYIPPWLFHPAAFFWTPFAVGAIGFLGWLFCVIFGLQGSNQKAGQFWPTY